MPTSPCGPSEGPLRPRAVRERRLPELADVLTDAALTGDDTTVVRGITHDSRHVQPGDLYLARPGEHTHGIRHVDDAVATGAVAVLTEPASVDRALAAGARTLVPVPYPRSAAGRGAAWFYGPPAASLTVVGITGTN